MPMTSPYRNRDEHRNAVEVRPTTFQDVMYRGGQRRPQTYTTAATRPVPLDRPDQNVNRLEVYYNATGQDPFNPQAQAGANSFVDRAIQQEQKQFWKDGFHDSGIPEGMVMDQNVVSAGHDQFWRDRQAEQRHGAQMDIGYARSMARPTFGTDPENERAHGPMADFYRRLNSGQEMSPQSQEQKDRSYVNAPGLTREERSRRMKEVEANRRYQEHMDEASRQFDERQATERHAADRGVDAARGQGAEAAEFNAQAAWDVAAAQRERFQVSPVGDVIDRDTGTITDRAARQETMQEMQFGDGTTGVFDGRTWIDKESGQPLHQSIPNFPIDPMVFMMLEPTVQKDLIDVWKQAFPQGLPQPGGTAQPGAPAGTDAGAPPREFTSVAEAQAAGLPSGTIVMIDGRRARID